MSNDESPATDRLADWYEKICEGEEKGKRDSINAGLITYGSLLHPEEIDALFRHENRIVEPVRVEGFRRNFNKSVAEHLRAVDGNQSGVLNVNREENEWFNGLLIGPLTEKGLRKYAFREREYGLTEIDTGNFEFYEDDRSSLTFEFNAVYTCLLESDEELDRTLAPEPDYLDLCLEGARHWGKEFYEDFLKKTYVQDEQLDKYTAIEE